MVGADTESAQGNKAAVGEGVRVQQQLLGAFVDLLAAVDRTRAAVVARVLVAGDGARVIQIRTPGGGERQISLANSALDLLKQRLTQLRLIGQLRFLIAVFSFQVVQNLFAIAIL